MRADFPLPGFSDFVFEAGLVARSIGDYFSGGALRLGVTGLSRSGKTVFLTALVNNLIAGARLPVLAASAEGRIMRARLEPQPDDAVPRFAYEEHMASLSGPDRRWPQSTRRIAELRLTIEFESAVGWGARSSTPQARSRRLSGRMAARPAFARQELRRMVARDGRGKRDPGPRAAVGEMAQGAHRPRPAGRRQRGRGAADRRSLHRLSAGGRATTSTRSRPCRPAGSSCRATSRARRL